MSFIKDLFGSRPVGEVIADGLGGLFGGTSVGTAPTGGAVPSPTSVNSSNPLGNVLGGFQIPVKVGIDTKSVTNTILIVVGAIGALVGLIFLIKNTGKKKRYSY